MIFTMKVLFLILIKVTSVVLQCYVTPDDYRECNYSSLIDPVEIVIPYYDESTRINIHNSRIAVLNQNIINVRRNHIKTIFINDSHVKELHNINVKELAFPFNEITEIKSAMFGKLLINLNASHNKIATFDFANFNQFVTKIDLSHNLLENLKSKTFHTFKGNTVININFNNIHTIENNLFDPDSLHKTLTLRGNQLKNISRSFAPYTPLVSLDLSLNEFEYLSGDFFIGLFTLKELNLADNQIRILETDCFKALNALIDLNLGNNKLRTFGGAFKDFTSLEKLSLAHNAIKNLDDDFINEGNSLKVLDLSYNTIESLHQKNFITLRKLKTLLLRGNGIHQKLDMCFGGLRSLQMLDLAHNNITEYDIKSFVGLKSLQTLYISANNISNLDDDAFMNTPSLTRLDVSENKLTNLMLHHIHKNTKLQSVNGNKNDFDCDVVRSFARANREMKVSFDYGSEIYKNNVLGYKCETSVKTIL